MTLRDRLTTLLTRALPEPRLRDGATGRARKPVRRIVLFGRHPNPTADYYFAARLDAPGMPPHRIVDIRAEDLDQLDPEGTFVILCRYTSSAVLRWIEKENARLAGVGFFTDDDIASIITGREADVGYRLFLFFRALMPLKRLNRHLDIVWASTPVLAERLKIAKARVLPPAPPQSLWNVDHRDNQDESADDKLLIAYHATSIHVDEHRFLQPIIESILKAHLHIRFEVFAGRAAAPVWKGMERVDVRKPTSWSAYLTEAMTRRIDIMLVPLAPSAVNACRSATKRIDIARAGAAGVFSISSAYGEADESGEIRLPYDAETWRETLVALIDDPAKRQAAHLATRRIVEAMTLQAKSGLGLDRA